MAFFWTASPWIHCAFPEPCLLCIVSCQTWVPSSQAVPKIIHQVPLPSRVSKYPVKAKAALQSLPYSHSLIPIPVIGNDLCMNCLVSNHWFVVTSGLNYCHVIFSWSFLASYHYMFSAFVLVHYNMPACMSCRLTKTEVTDVTQLLYLYWNLERMHSRIRERERDSLNRINHYGSWCWWTTVAFNLS